MLSLAQNYLTRGFWGDEAWTSLISQLPYLQMLKTTAADFHPPGYYTIVELVYKFLPPTEIVTRSISIFFYLLCGLVVYKLASALNGKTFGILSALLVLVNPIFFRYAFEARNYTMFAFCTVASMYFFLKLTQEFNWKRALPFIILTALGLYTHYFMFFVLASQGLYLILLERKIFLKMMAVYAAVGVLFLGWIPFLLGQLKSVSGDYWIGAIDWKHTHTDAVRRIFGGEIDNSLQLTLYRISVILCFIGFVQYIRKRANWLAEKWYLLLWIWAVVPFVLATLPGLQIGEFKLPLRPVFYWRYLIPAVVPFSLLIVYATQKLPKALFVLTLGTVIILSVIIDWKTFTSYPSNFKQAYEQNVLPTISDSDQIVTILPSFAEVLYYKNKNNLNNNLIVLPEGLVQFSGKSLLDAYVANGVVIIAEIPNDSYFELRPGPSVINRD